MSISYKHAKDTEAFKQIAAVIQKNLAQFKKEGALSVRPGYKYVGGLITPKPSIIVTVKKKSATVPADQKLPAEVGGFPVDVRTASVSEQLRSADPQRYARIVSHGHHEFELPHNENEVDAQTGKPITALAAAPHAPSKPEINYTPAPGVTLNAVEAPMAILCHVSPDAGWAQLQNFFNGIESRLTVGLYDFTSAHILQGLEQSLKKSKASLVLTLDHPMRNPSADQTDEQTVADLNSAIHDKMEQAWALVQSSPKAPKWIYPTAYHIKVAVRDSESMWLSSGNWNNSNQPVMPAGQAAAMAVAAKNDRDWHIIIDHEGLSRTYEAFLKHDFQVAASTEGSHAVPPSAASPAEDLKDLQGALGTVAHPPAQFFAPLRVPETGTKKIKIQPILTPDNYCKNVLPLIQSATKSFYMQTQYIHPSTNDGDQDFAQLIDAVVDLQKKKIDVRIILSEWEKQGAWLDLVQKAGVDLSVVKIQNNVHSKGIIVDSKTVMLGSQNWSGDGVIRNRDASVIVFDSDAAEYYEKIFIHDWTNMAEPCTASKKTGAAGT